jgi:hypothetical protein
MLASDWLLMLMVSHPRIQIQAFDLIFLCTGYLLTRLKFISSLRLDYAEWFNYAQWPVTACHVSAPHPAWCLGYTLDDFRAEY